MEPGIRLKPSPRPVARASRTIAPPRDRAGLRRRIAGAGGGAILETVAPGGEFGRYSIFAQGPVRTIALPPGSDEDPFAQLAGAVRPWTPADRECELPFGGGWIGYLPYEAGRFVEPRAGRRGSGVEEQALPASCWSLYDTVLIHDALLDRWMVAGVELPGELARTTRLPIEARLDAMERLAGEAGAAAREVGASSEAESQGRWNYSKGAYLEKVRSALEYIRAGDIFQVNLARRLRVAIDATPIDLYDLLCAANPAPFAAFIPAGRDGRGRQRAVISSSPELFLRVRGREVVTRPIKGTRPRGRTPEEDAAGAAALCGSEKDRAELNMIVDLERNDLGRVCEYGSVRVVEDGRIEAHPTVFHRTATVAGRLRPECDAIDLLRAAFPGGSITGAPKVRAMQIINELEPDLRGAYCGAIGYIGPDGGMELNLAIRTLSVSAGCVDLHVGSGIVADSDPEEEYEELEAKAAGMIAALGVEGGAEEAPRVVELARG